MTSSNPAMSASNWTFVDWPAATATSLLLYPMNENTSVTSSPDTGKVNFPSMSEKVAFCVPFSTTVTPGKPRPSSAAVTVPETILP